MANVLVQDSSLTAIADAIRGKNGETTLYKPGDMAAAIIAIPTGGGGDPSEIEAKLREGLAFTGNCNYAFYGGALDVIINNFGNYITTNDIAYANYMFQGSFVTSIPFSINLRKLEKDSWLGVDAIQAKQLFAYCQFLEETPELTGTPGDMNNMFIDCYRLKKINADNLDFSCIKGSNVTSHYLDGMFSGCRSLREIPQKFIELTCGANLSNNYFYRNKFNGCYVLDEVRGLGVQTASTWKNRNAFSSTFGECQRLKTITFAECNEPVNWSGQTIDLTYYVGYVVADSYMTNYNSGLTTATKVTNDATYQALKDNPDWWTIDYKYSRYNHDSAVETINSLPDTSAYLAANGGTNTINFKGNSGTLTDGGAINTLTEEEIAVAAAKGWTVSLV